MVVVKSPGRWIHEQKLVLVLYDLITMLDFFLQI
jgi:hypothetical protein